MLGGDASTAAPTAMPAPPSSERRVTAAVGSAGDARTDSVEMVGWSAMILLLGLPKECSECRGSVHDRALSRARAQCECPRRDRRKKIVGLRVRCPPTALPAAIHLKRRRRH